MYFMYSFNKCGMNIINPALSANLMGPVLFQPEYLLQVLQEHHIYLYLNLQMIQLVYLAILYFFNGDIFYVEYTLVTVYSNHNKFLIFLGLKCLFV
jgi:hypothetical protein